MNLSCYQTALFVNAHCCSYGDVFFFQNTMNLCSCKEKKESVFDRRLKQNFNPYNILINLEKLHILEVQTTFYIDIYCIINQIC